jgi:hypothetical protein
MTGSTRGIFRKAVLYKDDYVNSWSHFGELDVECIAFMDFLAILETAITEAVEFRQS